MSWLRIAYPGARQLVNSAGIEFPALTRSRVFKMLDYAKEQRWGSGHGEH
jgi:hypothetical protein